MIASIPSGLCIGPEGPIIHICAMVAQHTAKVINILERKWSKNTTVVKMDEIRDFLATGAGCGICAAFYAPLAGVLFVVEEV